MMPPTRNSGTMNDGIATSVARAASLPGTAIPAGIAYLRARTWMSNIKHTAMKAAGISPAINNAPTDSVVIDPNTSMGKLGGMVSPMMAAVSYTHLRAHETRHDLVCRL